MSTNCLSRKGLHLVAQKVRKRGASKHGDSFANRQGCHFDRQPRMTRIARMRYKARSIAGLNEQARRLLYGERLFQISESGNFARKKC
jgi:hypothetical protein